MKELAFESNDVQYKIRAGENAQENWDLIDSSAQNDLWFHVKSHPSCHVVVSLENAKNISIKKIDPQVIRYCGSICKAGSKLKHFGSVTIMYTYIKNVKKAEEIGSVTTTSSKTINV